MVEKSFKGENFERFSGVSLLAVDFGTKRIGLSLFIPGNDPFPMPYGKVENSSSLQQTLQRLKEFLAPEYIEALIIGLPHLTDGQETEMTAQARNFGKALARELKLPCYTQDETLSSFEAEERMKRSPRYNFKIDREQIDALAASIIMEDFLASSRAEKLVD